MQSPDTALCSLFSCHFAAHARRSPLPCLVLLQWTNPTSKSLGQALGSKSSHEWREVMLYRGKGKIRVRAVKRQCAHDPMHFPLLLPVRIAPTALGIAWAAVFILHVLHMKHMRRIRWPVEYCIHAVSHLHYLCTHVIQLLPFLGADD